MPVIRHHTLACGTGATPFPPAAGPQGRRATLRRMHHPHPARWPYPASPAAFKKECIWHTPVLPSGAPGPPPAWRISVCHARCWLCSFPPAAGGLPGPLGGFKPGSKNRPRRDASGLAVHTYMRCLCGCIYYYWCIPFQFSAPLLLAGLSLPPVFHRLVAEVAYPAFGTN